MSLLSGISIKSTCFALLTGLLVLPSGCKAQGTYGTRFLSLQKVVKLPGVRGRIDHLAVDKAHQVVYMAALGNNTLEVIDLSKGKVIHEIKGLDEPQGVAYLPQANAVFVANGGNGVCAFYDANTYKQKAELDLGEDADNVSYAQGDQTVYVGYGNGGIALINAASMKAIGTIRLPGHPEGFEVDSLTKKIWANVPDARVVAVLDGKNRKAIDAWRINAPLACFPIAYSSQDHRLFIGGRRPSRLLVLDSETGKKIAEAPCAGDADNLFYDAASKRILISGGSGYVDIFKQQDTDTYTQIAHIATRIGARTSLWVPEWKEFLLAVPERNGQPAALLVYKMND
ncbi:YncE family protein [Pontibacter sp. 172403-2]|uniref:YncE family protein n=1 Tax=Pontibacter rufus TaxID=2791028 RepID=UPI0018AFE264|nr:YncE family protein [Pontibacter sp. 172403-2]MBF9252157.1 YncE family protein [Pontibacter sp. 172403-2]